MAATKAFALFILAFSAFTNKNLFYFTCRVLTLVSHSVFILTFVIVNALSTRGHFPGTMKILGGLLRALIFNLNTSNWSAGLVTGMGLVPRVTQTQTPVQRLTPVFLLFSENLCRFESS